MGHTFLLRSPKKEEQEVLENFFVPEYHEFDDDFTSKETDHVLDELEAILGIEDENKVPCGGQMMSWDFMNWEGFTIQEDEKDQKMGQMGLFLQDNHTCFSTNNVKTENCGFWDDIDHHHQEKKMSLNLSLNYEEVLDAWSGRGSLFADECALSNNGYMGEVPIMEEDRTRREASVLRYKEKRQSRLFSKKIRYQVRKLNADNRPRLKGRFVKRVAEKLREEG